MLLWPHLEAANVGAQSGHVRVCRMEYQAEGSGRIGLSACKSAADFASIETDFASKKWSVLWEQRQPIEHEASSSVHCIG